MKTKGPTPKTMHLWRHPKPGSLIRRGDWCRWSDTIRWDPVSGGMSRQDRAWYGSWVGWRVLEDGRVDGPGQCSDWEIIRRKRGKV